MAIFWQKGYGYKWGKSPQLSSTKFCELIKHRSEQTQIMATELNIIIIINGCDCMQRCISINFGVGVKHVRW